MHGIPSPAAAVRDCAYPLAKSRITFAVIGGTATDDGGKGSVVYDNDRGRFDIALRP
jgi:hypothetical protein